MKIKRIFLISTILCITLVISACGTNKATMPSESTVEQQNDEDAVTVKKISAEDAYARMQSKEPLIVLDVRTAEEYESSHIPGAMLLPNEEIGDTRPTNLPVLDTEILIYCRSGNRSAQAAAKLSELGYTNVYDFGGINDWNYETESGAWQSQEKDGSLSSFTAYDLNGVQQQEDIFSEYKLTMVNVWATFCGPCLSEMPELGEMAADYAEQSFQVVGIISDISQNSDGTYTQSKVEGARQLVDETKANYTHLMTTPQLLSKALRGVTAVPTTIFVNEKGEQIGDAYIGARSGEDWRSIVDELLEEVKA